MLLILGLTCNGIVAGFLGFVGLLWVCRDGCVCLYIVVLFLWILVVVDFLEMWYYFSVICF